MSSILEKLQKAAEYKAKGNELFKQQRYKKAIVAYSTSIAYTRGLPGTKHGINAGDGMAAMAYTNSKVVDKCSESEASQAIELESVVLVNISASYLKLGKAIEALEYSEKSIAMASRYWKAYLRKAEALARLGRLEAAISALDECSRITPDDAAKTAVMLERRKVAQQKALENKSGLFSSAAFAAAQSK